MNVCLITIGWLSLVPAQCQTGDENHSVLLGSDGSVMFERERSPEVTYTHTDLVATAEATKYPWAVKQLLTEETREGVVPVEKVIESSRLSGWLTMEVTELPALVLAKDGKQLVIRPPTDSERIVAKKETLNPAGLLAAISVVLLLVGNLIIAVKPKNEDAVFAAAFAAVAAFAAAAVAFAAVAAFAVAVAAFFAAAFFAAAENKKVCHVVSAISVALMVTAVFMAL